MKTLLQIVATFLSVVLAGCIVVPVPASGKKVAFGTRIQTNDLTFVEFGATTRPQLEAQIGVPWTNYADLRVSVYYWEEVSHHWRWVIFVPGPGFGYARGGVEDMGSLELLLVGFTEDDTVERFQTMRHPKKKSTKDTATAWLLSP